MDLDALLKAMVEKDASDLHLKVGSPPCMRIHGELYLTKLPRIDAVQNEKIAMDIMTETLKERFREKNEVDFAYSLSGVGRFRVNIFKQRGSIGMTLRRVTIVRPTIEELGLPDIVSKLSEESRGLILVTGTAGSGKTTTLAAMIDHINHTHRAHIVTIEDPIEVLHRDDKSIINQREIGIDTDSYEDALKHVVRQDPDVILIGEMRDKETVRAALSAAETGHLVLSSLHTIDSTETINRIIDFFPPYQQKQVRLMMASTVRGIISLRLLSKVGGGRIPAVEVMVSTGTIREYIVNEEETSLIIDAIEQGEYYGMQTFDQSLIDLYENKLIVLDEAVNNASNPHNFKLKLNQLEIKDTDSFEEEEIDKENDSAPQPAERGTGDSFFP